MAHDTLYTTIITYSVPLYGTRGGVGYGDIGTTLQYSRR